MKSQLNVEVFPTSLPQTNAGGHSLMEHLKRWFHWLWFCDCWLVLGGCYMVSAILGQNASPDCGVGCLILMPAVGCCWVRFQQCEETQSNLRATSARGKRSQALFTCIFQVQYRSWSCRGSGEKLSRLIYWSSRRLVTPWSIIWLVLLSIQHAWIDHVSTAPPISLARGRGGVW